MIARLPRHRTCSGLRHCTRSGLSAMLNGNITGRSANSEHCQHYVASPVHTPSISRTNADDLRSPTSLAFSSPKTWHPRFKLHTHRASSPFGFGGSGPNLLREPMVKSKRWLSAQYWDHTIRMCESDLESGEQVVHMDAQPALTCPAAPDALVPPGQHIRPGIPPPLPLPPQPTTTTTTTTLVPWASRARHSHRPMRQPLWISRHHAPRRQRSNASTRETCSGITRENTADTHAVRTRQRL